MSGGGGGGTTNTVSQPWSGAQPFLKDAMNAVQFGYKNPAPYFPGQTFVGPTSAEMQAWNTRLGYADDVFGGSAAPKFGEATNALSGALNSGFGPAGTAGGLDARGAINSALSGTPDYSGLDSMAAAANAPLLRQFNEQVLPGLNTRATFLNNPTGGIKELNRVMPELGQRMSENTMNLYNQERNRALSSRDAAAGLVSGLGSTANQQALGALGLFPTIAQTGEVPGVLASNFAQFGRGFQEQALNDQMNRFNYYANLPRDNASWYMGNITGAAGLGGSQTSSTSTNGSKLAGAAGGGLAGYGLAQGLGSFFGPGLISNPVGWGITGLGAALGGLL